MNNKGYNNIFKMIHFFVLQKFFQNISFKKETNMDYFPEKPIELTFPCS